VVFWVEKVCLEEMSSLWTWAALVKLLPLTWFMSLMALLSKKVTAVKFESAIFP
jgi:hypothetical protein